MKIGWKKIREGVYKEKVEKTLNDQKKKTTLTYINGQSSPKTLVYLVVVGWRKYIRNHTNSYDNKNSYESFWE